MEPDKILSAQLIDLVFDDRNKEYGAYELRKTYSRRIKKSLFITASVAALAFGGAVLANSAKRSENKYKISDEIFLSQVPDEKKPEPIPEPEKKPEAEQVKTEKLTVIAIKPDDEVTDPPPSQEDLVDSKIGLEKQEGMPDDGISKPEEIDKGIGKGIIVNKVDNQPDEPFTTVEIDAKFNGNWKAFLERNLNAGVATDNNAPAGRYSVVIQFVVDVEGNVSDIKPLTNHGYGLEAEALRVLKKAAKWEPAIQNGVKVKAYRKQVIVFEVTEDE